MHWLLFRQNLKIALDQSDASEDETEEITVKETTTGSKRARPPSPESSPKKLKMLIVDALTHGGPNLLKNMKRSDFLAKLSIKSLGLLSEQCVFVPLRAVVHSDALKKKRNGLNWLTKQKG